MGLYNFLQRFGFFFFSLLVVSIPAPLTLGVLVIFLSSLLISTSSPEEVEIFLCIQLIY